MVKVKPVLDLKEAVTRVCGLNFAKRIRPCSHYYLLYEIEGNGKSSVCVDGHWNLIGKVGGKFQ